MSARPPRKLPPQLNSIESLLIAQTIWDLGDSSTTWTTMSKLLSKHPLVSRPKSFFTAQSCRVMYEYLMKEAKLQPDDTCTKARSPIHLKLAQKYYLARFHELRDLISAEENKFKQVSSIHNHFAPLMACALFRTVLKEIDELQAGLWDKAIVAKLTGKPIPDEASASEPKDSQTTDEASEPAGASRASSTSLLPETDRKPTPAAQPPVETPSGTALPESAVPSVEDQEEDASAVEEGQPHTDTTEEEADATDAALTKVDSDEGSPPAAAPQEEEEDADSEAQTKEEEEEEEDSQAPEDQDAEAEDQIAVKSEEPSEAVNEPEAAEGGQTGGASSAEEEEPVVSTRRSTRRRKSSATSTVVTQTRSRLRRGRGASGADLNESDGENDIEMKDDASQVEEEHETKRRDGKRKASFVDGIESPPDNKRAREESEPAEEEEGRVPSSPSSSQTQPAQPAPKGPSSHNTRSRSTRHATRTEEQVALKRFQNVIGLLHSQISQHRNGNIFHNPIKNSEAPDYHDIVKRPMDLKTIKTRIKDGLVTNSLEFQRDIYLMFANAMMYNRPGSDVYAMAEDMMLESEGQIQAFRQTEGLVKRGQRQ